MADAAAPTPEAEAAAERRIMQYCGAHGIPRSVFLGRVVTPGEPEWLPEDAVAALRWQAEQDALCAGCHQPRSESFDRAARYNVKSHTCQGCAAREQASWLAQKNHSKNAQPQFGVYFGLTKAD